jgi:hypothetical protein
MSVKKQEKFFFPTIITPLLRYSITPYEEVNAKGRIIAFLMRIEFSGYGV